jgi:hypothetical protein
VKDDRGEGGVAILSLAATSTQQHFSITILGILILITANIFCDANYRMTSHRHAEHEEPTTDSEFDVEEGIEGTETPF